MKAIEKNIKNTLIRNIIISIIISASGMQKTAAQDYVLNLSDPSTYTITCGRVNAGMWLVKNDTCILYTSFIRAEIEPGATVTFSFRVNQSGNGDEYDKAYIYHSIDGGEWVMDKKWNAGGFPAVYTLTTSIYLEQFHFVQFMIRLSTNNKTEFWGVLDGGISATDNNNQAHDVFAYTEQPEDPSDLPIDLYSFTGKNQGSKNILNWITVSETNNDYFVVERSMDGNSFYELGNMSGAGNSNTLTNYDFEDDAPLPFAYYRLKQVDYDGAYTYSPVITISSGNNSNDISIFSTASGLAISSNAEYDFTAKVDVYNLSGQIVYTTDVNINEGAGYNVITPDVDMTGLHLVAVSLENEVLKTNKVIF